MDLFSNDVNLHRVAVIDNNGEVISIVSQIRVIEEVAKHLDSFGTLGQRKIHTYFTRTDLISVPDSMPIAEAFQVILQNGITGVAVTNSSGELCGNLSGSDLKRACKDPVEMMIAMNGIVSDLLNKNSDPSRPAAISVTDNDPISSVFEKMTKYKVHRVYVVDEHNHPRKVITASGLISFLGAEYRRRNSSVSQEFREEEEE